MGRMIEATRMPPARRMAEMQSIDQKLETDAQSGYMRLTRMLSMIATPAMARASEIAMRLEAELAATRAGVAVLQYWAAEGRWPAMLSDVAPTYLPAVPVDPFNGKPIAYKPAAAGFVTYSVGGDGVDHGGTTFDAAGTEFGPGTDITFVCRVPAQLSPPPPQSGPTPDSDPPANQ
jgi:hypothetical protein